MVYVRSSECHQRLRSRSTAEPCRCAVPNGVSPPARTFEYAFACTFVDGTGAIGPVFLPSVIAESLLHGTRPDVFEAMSEPARTDLKVRILKAKMGGARTYVLHAKAINRWGHMRRNRCCLSASK